MFKKFPLVLTCILAAASLLNAAAFTAGNIVVYRVGDTLTLNANAAPVFLEEYSPTGTLIQTIALPVADSLPQRRYVNSGSATSEGYFSLSVNGKYLVMSGYSAAVGTLNIATSSVATAPRVIARADFSGALDTRTAISASAVSGGNTRTAATTDGSSLLWMAGAAGGIQNVPVFGADNAALNAVGSGNIRVIGIFGGQLFYSTGSAPAGIYSIGSGLPVASAGATQIAASTSPYGFFFADLSAVEPGVDTLYVADDSAAASGGGIRKYSKVSGAWTLNNVVTLTAARGLTGSVSGTTVTLFAIGNGNTLVKIVDTAGYNASNNGTAASLATPGANRAFRGVAIAPQNSFLTPATLTSGTAGAPYSQTVSITGGNACAYAVTAGTLPANLVLDSVSGVITGTPVSGGASNITITGTCVNITSSQDYALVVSGGVAPTNPTASGTASSVFPSNATSFSGTIVPGTNPASSGLAVTCNLSGVGGSSSFALTVTANSFSGNYTVPNGTAAQTYSLPCSVSDAEARSSSFNISLVVQGVVNPSGSGVANPSPVTAGNSTTLTATIVPGTNPVSTVTCNLAGIGGSTAFNLPNTTGNTWSASYMVPAVATDQAYSLGCTVTDNQALTGAFNIALTVTSFTCGAPKTLIGVIQSSGAASALTTQVLEIEGTVTGSYQGTGGLNGFYIQDEGDGNPATSDGIFIDESVGGSQGAVAAGNKIRLKGAVAETFGQTVINTVTAQIGCGTGTVTPVDVNFPAATATSFEQFEGMLVRFPQQLRVTDNFNLGRFGELSLAFVPNYGDGVTYTRLMAGTQVAAPGSAALAATDLNSRSRIILDDGTNNTYGNLAPSANWPQDGGGLSFTNTIRLGDRVNVDLNGTHTPIVAVLGFGFSAYRIQPVPGQPITFGPSDNPRPATPPSVGGRVKVMSANVLNYFTTYTTVDSNARGADNATEFARQRDKIIAAFKTADAAVIAISELENNTSEAIENMVNDPGGVFGNSLNTGNPGKWAYINTGVVGTDAIRGAFIYQPGLVQAVGVYKVLDSAVDSRALTTRNRPAIAQTFRLLSGGKPALQHFTVVANHFKSKGSACTSSPNDPFVNDGQDDCNLSRVSMAEALIDWLATNPTGDPTPANDRRFLIVGDLNAHLKEDPISALTSTAFTKPSSAVFPTGIASNPNAVYKDLVGTLGDRAGYSYLFSTESGALDHALANPPLFKLVTGVSEWHINADEPVVLDYNSDYDGNGAAGHSQQKTAAQMTAYFNAGPFRTSDHDPLLVGFNPLAGDLNDDGVVDAADQTIMRNAIGKPLATVDRRTDFDGDGRITLTDFARWSSYAAQYQR